MAIPLVKFAAEMVEAVDDRFGPITAWFVAVTFACLPVVVIGLALWWYL